MANRDRSVDSGAHPSTGGLRGGFANTRPMVLYVGTAVAVVWDIVAFVHLFHFSLWRVRQFLVAVGVVVAGHDRVGMVELAWMHGAVVGLGTSGYWGLHSRGHD